MDADEHCAALVREADRDRFLASLFAPAVHRPALLALYAFNAEVARVPARVTNALAGEIRLQWWADVLNGERREEAAANPVAAALLSAVARYGLRAEPLADLVAAHAIGLYDEPIPSMDVLESHATRTSAALIGAAALILNGGVDPGVGALTFQAGVAAELTDVLRAFPLRAPRGQSFLPLDLLARHGLGQEELTVRAANLPLRAALAELRLRIRGRLDAAGPLIGAAPATILPALLPMALVRPLLARMERADYDPFVPVELPQWRRQWILWRAARRPARIAGG